MRFEGPHDREHHTPDRRHHAEQREALTSIAHQRAVGACQADRNDQDRKDFHDVAERRRILERMRRVRRQRAAAVGSEFLDRLLRSERPHHASGRITRHRREAEAAVPRLHHTLSQQQNRDDHAERQENTDARTRQVDPEVADQSVAASIHQPSDERDGHSHADGGRHEVLHRESEHLGKVAHHHFWRIRLPVGVGDKRDRGVERRRRIHTWLAVRPGQHALQPLQQVEEQKRDQRKGQYRKHVADPRLFASGVDASQRVDRALGQQVASAAVHAGHVVAQRHVDDCENQDDERHLERPRKG